MPKIFNIPVGSVRKDVYEVKKEHMPTPSGDKEIPVLSTPSMISMMETTSKLLIEERLPKGYTTVGIRIDVKHIRPAPVGGRVEVSSELLEVDGKRLRLKVEAYFKGKKIGEGLHERYIINLEEHLKRISEL